MAGQSSNTATQTYACNGGASEYWQFAVQPSAAAGALSTAAPYSVVNQASGNCLTGNANGVQNSVSACTGAAAQLWWLVPTPFAGYYALVNSATGARGDGCATSMAVRANRTPPGRCHRPLRGQ